jgi:L,D-transpeptidase catalytic domain
MPRKTVSRLSNTGLALAGLTLGLGLTHSDPLSAQFSKYSPYGGYGGYGSYGGSRQQQYYDDGYQEKSYSNDRGDMVPFKRTGVPLLALVALDAQRVSIYDGSGRMIQQSPVSTGSTGYETPAGIFSVVQKKPVHNSNLYQDGNMPFMQRITWTGIALHAGVLPGHPASHGCVRLPIAFAERLFELTDVGMRVVIAPSDVPLTEFSHPKLFAPKTLRIDSGRRTVVQGSPEHITLLKSIASTKASEAEAVTRKATEAKRAAERKASESTAAAKALRTAEERQERAAAQLKDAERDIETATASTAANAADLLKRAEQGRETAKTRLAEAETQLATAKAQAQAKSEAAAAADADAKSAEEAKDAALDASLEAERKGLPVSVFISRKTQRLYVRQGYKPVFEGPVTIQDADKPIGTYIFTALNHTDNQARWGMISMYGPKGAEGVVREAPRKGAKGEARRVEAVSPDTEGAKRTLDRISIPPETLKRISDVVLPGSSLIVSDEGLSIETGKDTDFVVVMSGEPQGALKVRQREPVQTSDGWGFYGNAPYGKSSYGGGGSFFKW